MQKRTYTLTPKVIELIQNLYDFEYMRLSSSGREVLDELVDEINNSNEGRSILEEAEDFQSERLREAGISEDRYEYGDEYDEGSREWC